MNKSPSSEADDLGIELARFNRAFRSAVERALEDVALSTSEYTALSVVEAHPQITAVRLARAMLISRQVAGRVVAQLVTAGLVSTTHSPSGRISSASITTRGTHTLSEARERVRAVESQILSPLAPNEALALISAMRRCADATGLQLLPGAPRNHRTEAAQP